MVLVWDKLLSVLKKNPEKCPSPPTHTHSPPATPRSHLIEYRVDPIRSSPLLEFFPPTHTFSLPLSPLLLQASRPVPAAHVSWHTVDSHTSVEEILHSDVQGGSKCPGPSPSFQGSGICLPTSDGADVKSKEAEMLSEC